MPFVPIGCESFAHDKPGRRKSFAQHCSKGWVLGTSPEHYRARVHWTPHTRTTRISATMFFKHKYISNPTVTPADAVVAATTNIEKAITRNQPEQNRNENNYRGLTKLQQILARAQLYTSAQAKENAVGENPPDLVRDYDDEDSDDEDEEENNARTAPDNAPSPRVQTTTVMRSVECCIRAYIWIGVCIHE